MTTRPAPSFTKLFPACRDALDEARRPLHYHELTRRGLARIGVPIRDIQFSEVCEDVREKLLIAEQYDTFYTGKPLRLAALRSWFKTEQPLLFQFDTIVIPGNASAGARGAYEGLMRYAYMLQKTTMERRASGLVLEQHVALWFKEHWPTFYQPPDNAGQWDKPCDHDFKLAIGNTVLKVDVSGPRYNGQFGNPGNGKHRTHLHLICEIGGQDVYWRGVVAGREYNDIVVPELARSPLQMVVWLNCLQDSIAYDIVSNAACRHRATSLV